MSKLEEMLKYVSEHNEFYKNRIKEYGIKDPLDINQWPILTREELHANRYNMFSDGYRSKYLDQQLKRQSSSGSSGTPVNVYWDYKDYYNSIRILWRYRLKYYGIHPNYRFVKFTLNVETFTNCKISYLYEHKNVLNINLSTIKNDDDYEQMINIINDFNPMWLYIQPFVLHRLIEFYIRFNKTPSPSISYIESVGELLPTELRKRAFRFFNAPVINLYGSEEMNGIAYDCPYDHMHVLKDNVYIECKNGKDIDNFGEGEAIITNLVNKAMPLIRYNQGDIIQLNNLSTACDCKSGKLIIKLIKGRAYENVKVDNIELNPYILTTVLSNINNEFDHVITCYHYVYSKSSKKLICYIEINRFFKHWLENIRHAIYLKLRTELQNIPSIYIEVHQESRSSLPKKHKVLEIID